MTDIPGTIDIKAACAGVSRAGILGKFSRRRTPGSTRLPSLLEAARIELDQLVRLMGETLEQLLSFKETLEQHARRFEHMGDESEAAALAASSCRITCARTGRRSRNVSWSAP